ncbi:TPA: ATP-binding protein, partial [Enterobacter ludwigii]|nr:ATP-binding protein [Enterobacter ludwigii]
MEFLARNQNADRVCEGISKIGYKFHAAIEDIIDNSVAAGAKNISVQFVLEEGANLSEKSKIRLLRINDDGKGMSNDIAANSLDLGADSAYEENSLSKFGFGLKSAGFSLGRRVTIYSKQDGVYTEKYFLDRDIIKEKNIYGVCVQHLDEDERSLVKAESGTIVEISKIREPHDSTNKIIKELRERLGVIYHDFMLNEGLSITLIVKNKEELILPKDILFWGQARHSYDPDNYDAKKPCKVINKDIEISPSVDTKVKVRAVIFPQERMAQFQAFSEDERAAIKSYDISRKNNGFFIFRNNRLIRWGDLLGIAGRDDIGFRARIDIYTCHDEILQVDVSKQNLDLSEHFLDALQMNCRVPLSQARDAFEKCKDILDVNGGEEGLKTSETLETIPEEDPDLDYETVDKKEQTERRTKNQQKTSEEDIDKEELPKDIKNDDKPVSEEDVSEPTVTYIEPVFKKVRYSDKINKSVIFCSEIDIESGVYIRINKNHLFYNLVLKSLPEADPT